MKITRYHTRSGSIYDVREDNGVLHIRRARLGEAHLKAGPEQVAKRNRDKLDGWRRCDTAYCHGEGYVLAVSFGPGDRDTLMTSPVLSIRSLEEYP